MDSTLDFVTRARHAFKEFRQPSELDTLSRQQHDAEKGEHRDPAWHPDPSQYTDERTPLESYRLLVGIHQDKSFSPPHGFRANRRPQLSIEHRPSPNLGIYSTVCDAEIKQKRNYKFTSRLINFCLGLQIVVAAALTALGAANGSRSAVTVFGAINTVIAGFLTYLKGSGLPHRIKYYQHEWAKVREYIEQRERDFSFGLLNRDHVLGEVTTIRQMYEMVRADIETNTPDRFVGTNNHMIQPPPRLVVADSAVGQQISEKQAALDKQFSAKQAEAQAAMDKAQASAAGFFGQARGMKEMLENKIRDLGHMEKEIESNGQKMVDEKKQGLAAQVGQTVKEMASLGKELETRARAALADGQDAINKSQEQAQATVANTQENAAAALAQQRLAAESVVNSTTGAVGTALAQQQSAAENAITSTSNAAAGAIDRQREDAERAIHQTSDAARDAIRSQRQAAATAIAPTEGNAPPRPS